MNDNDKQLIEYLHTFWSKEKLGKKPEMFQIHFELLKSYFAGLNFKDFFEELNKSILNLQETKFITYNYMYDNTIISSYLNHAYLNAALSVTSSQPTIGPGEFLFASIFKNIGFNSSIGDLIDLNTMKTIEVKSTNGRLCTGKEFIPLSNSKLQTLQTLISKYKIKNNYTSINKNLCLELLSYLKGSYNQKNELYYIGLILQNLVTESKSLSKAFIQLVNSKVKFIYDINEAIKLYGCIISMHLFCYCKLHDIYWFIATTDVGFRIFKAPNNLFEAYDMLSNFKVNTWQINNNSTSISLK